MSSPHLRRRYRATGARSGLTYVLVLLAAGVLYVAERVYTDREHGAVNRLDHEIGELSLRRDRLMARRDSLLALTVIQPRAQALGLRAPDLEQMARLPLSAFTPPSEPSPAAPVAFSDAARRVWRWLDPPGIGQQEVRAGE